MTLIILQIIGEDGENIKALVVQAKGKARTNYKFHCDVQDIYLRTCLDGAKSQGEDFLEEFKKCLEVNCNHNTLINIYNKFREKKRNRHQINTGSG